MEITENYYLVTEADNSVDASILNPEEWLLICRNIFERCGKFLEVAYENNSAHRNDRKTLGECIFEHLLPGSGYERRLSGPDMEKEAECLPYRMPLNTVCIRADKIFESKAGDIFFERWLVVMLNGWLLLVDINFQRRERKEKKPHGYDEIVTRVSYCLDGGEHQKQFSDRLLPYLDHKLAKKIIYYGLDILEFDKFRREKEADEFARAFEFRRMVLERINFPSHD